MVPFVSLLGIQHKKKEFGVEAGAEIGRHWAVSRTYANITIPRKCTHIYSVKNKIKIL